MYTLHFDVYIYEIFIDRYTLKMLGCFKPMDKPKRWVKNVPKINPMAGFVHI